jgi:hypothetical protein
VRLISKASAAAESRKRLSQIGGLVIDEVVGISVGEVMGKIPDYFILHLGRLNKRTTQRTEWTQSSTNDFKYIFAFKVTTNHRLRRI